MLTKCREWDESVPAGADVAFGGEPVMALSISFALTLALARHGVACLVFGGSARRGFAEASSEFGRAEIFFFAASSELVKFWRRLYELEDTPEEDFFALAHRAFPALIFHADLSFRRFSGAYRDLRPAVVTHLAVLNDQFMAAYEQANGIARQIESALASAGCTGVSPESPGTHKNQQAMSQRDVQHDGATVRCEWHAKLEPHRNRIHFAFGDRFGGRVFIGIFAEHLPA